MTMTTSYVENAIELAVQGGYDSTKVLSPLIKADKSSEQFLADVMSKYFKKEYVYPKIFLDPLFWSSLGKSLGWDEGMLTDATYKNAPPDMWMWHHQWHRFIDSLAEGKSAESFFESLINVKG